MPPESGTGSEKNQSRVCELPIVEGLGIREQLLIGEVAKRLIGGFVDPSFAKFLDCGRIKIVLARVGTHVCGEVMSSLGEDFAQAVGGQLNEAVIISHPELAFVLDRRANGSARNVKDQHAPG